MTEGYNKITEIVRSLVAKAGFAAKVSLSEGVDQNNKFSVVSVESEEDLSMLIGKGGQSLAALEHVARVIAAHTNNLPELNFIIDINDYRKSRANAVVQLARDTVDRVLNTKRAEALSPMTAYERRLVHMELASYTDIQTESIGEEPYRRIVIKPEFV